MMRVIAMFLGEYAGAARAWNGLVRLVKFLYRGGRKLQKLCPNFFLGKIFLL